VGGSFFLTPDGQFAVFNNSNSALKVVSTAGGSAPQTLDSVYSSICLFGASPDSSRFLYETSGTDGTGRYMHSLKLVSVAGGTPAILGTSSQGFGCSGYGGPRPTFTPSANVLFVPGDGTLQVASADGASLVALASVANYFEASRDGSMVLFTDSSNIKIVPIGGGTPTSLGQGWLPYNSPYYSNGNLSPDAKQALFVDGNGILDAVSVSTQKVTPLAVYSGSLVGWASASSVVLSRYYDAFPYGYEDGVYLINLP
jgi:hypothetical protein